MYDLENTTWYKVASGNGGSEPMEKFDYIIPTISFDPAETTATISNTTITDMLDEMSTRLKTEAEPLLIGLYLHDSDVGCDDFILLTYSLDPDSDYVTLKGLSYSFGLVTINNESNTWKIYHTNI